MAVTDLGMVRPGSTILIPFAAFDSNDPSASVIISDFVLADIGIYKGTSMTERASTTGVVLLDTDGIDIDGAVGIHGFSIDLSSNATADFYTCGSRFYVTCGPITIDAATINFVPATFQIGQEAAVHNTTIATLASQTSFTITDGSADDDAYNGCPVYVQAIASAIQVAIGVVSDYTGSTKTVTLAADPAIYTMAAGDHISLFMPSNVVAISGDITAADNLELMYDGTGYTNDTAPASRAQVDGIGASSGGALNFANEADNVDSAIKGITFDGVETSGTNASVNSEDGVYHVIDDTANNIDIVYQFDVGGGRTGVEITWKGYLNSANDEATVQAYNGTSFDTLFTISGKGGATNDTHVIPLLSTHTGTGADIGKVFIRIECAAQSNPTLNTDSLLVSAVNIGQSVGYALGAIWLDTVNGVAGTEDFVNGTADNPVKSIADTNTLLASRNLARVVVSPSSSVTFAATQADQIFAGEGWTLALGGQSISGSHITGADVSGTGTGASEVHFEHCEMGICTLAKAHLDDCDIEGTVTLSAADTYLFVNCSHSGGTATIDFGSAIGNTTVHVHNYHGALTIANMGQTGTDVLHFSSPDGKLTLAASCIGGTVHMNGTFDFTNSGSGMTINSDGAILSPITLPGQAAPPLAPTAREVWSWMYKVFRNRKDQTSTLWQLYADNETTVDAKATVSDDGTTAIKQEVVTGP